MRDLFDKEFQKEMDDFFDYIDYEVLGREKPESVVLTREEADELDKDKIFVYNDTPVNFTEEDDCEEVSDCCGADVYDDYDICSSCNDHCGREEAEI